MPSSDLVNLTINLAEPPIPLAGFGVPLIGGDLDADIDTAFGASLTLELTPATWKTQLASVLIVSSDEIYKQVNALFSQSRQPALALLARRATPIAQVDNVSVDTAEAGTYTISINGSDATVLAAAETTTQIRDLLITAVDALGEPVSAGVGAGADDLDITADEAGESFSISVTHTVTPANISTTSSTSNLGLSEDIVAWKAERDDWYALAILERTSGQIREGASAIESELKIFIAQTDDSDADGAAVTDLGTELKALGYVRTGLVYNDTDTEYVDTALLGQMLPSNPGSETWANQSLTGVTGLVPASSTSLKDKNYIWLESFESGAFSMTREGTAVDGTYLDLVRGRDWLHNLMKIRLLQLLRDSPKVPYSTDGGQQVGGTIEGSLQEAADADLVARASIVITIPVPEDQSGTNKGNRHLPNVTWGATLLGAIHSMDVTGNLGT